MMDLQNQRVQRIALGLFCTIVFVIFWQVSCSYYGPAYLSDEIGYLSKAAALGGHPVDIASSWHGGYSIILSPLFAFLSDPFQVWKGIMALNALIFSLSFAVLFYLIKELFPDEKIKDIFVSVCIASIYPCWITMSGYAFSTPFFIFVLLLAVYILSKTSSLRTSTVLLHSFLVGFLYWIHPTGLIVILSSTLVMLCLAFYYRRFSLLFFHILVLIAMVFVYKLIFHEWLDQMMTPQGYDAKSHYQSISMILECIQSLRFWEKWFIFVLGHSSYLLISTLGLIIFPFAEAVKRIRKHYRDLNQVDHIFQDASLVLLLLSIVGIIFLGALSFATSPGSELTVDHWIYGRYTEVVLFPLLAAGFLLRSDSLKAGGYGAVFVVLSGILLFNITANIHSDLITSVNQVNIPAFWPKVILTQPSLLKWFLLGALGIMLVSFLKKKSFLILIILLFLSCIFNQKTWHQEILSYYSKPTDLLGTVQKIFLKGQCIGFDTFIPENAFLYQHERYNLYSYYFFNYDYRRMDPEEWVNTCEGPYLTYRPDVFENTQNTWILAKEINSGLCMVIKQNILDELDLELGSSDNILIHLSGDSAGIINGCFDMKAFEASKFSQVGRYEKGKLVTEEKAGYLFYGPYRPLKQGHYFMNLNVCAANPEGAVFDIVSDKGKTSHLKIKLADYSGSGWDKIVIPFFIDHDVKDIEVRLFVDSFTQMEFIDYSITVGQGMTKQF